MMGRNHPPALNNFDKRPYGLFSYIYRYMETPKERQEQLIKLMDERHATWAEETWAFICENGAEKWTMGYTLSYRDKLEQVDILVEYFENLEKYEVCSKLMSIRRNIQKNNYLL